LKVNTSTNQRRFEQLVISSQLQKYLEVVESHSRLLQRVQTSLENGCVVDDPCFAELYSALAEAEACIMLARIRVWNYSKHLCTPDTFAKLVSIESTSSAGE
jgi:hypothetical protein